MEFDWNTLVQLLGVVASFGAFGLTATSLTEFVKNKLGLEGNVAYALYWAIAIVTGTAQLIMAGELDQASFNIENLATSIGLIAFVSKGLYERFIK